MRSVRAIEGVAYAAGMMRQVYRRDGANSWSPIDKGMRASREDKVCGFEAIDGFTHRDIYAAGYKGEKVVILAATSIPAIFAEAQVASDVLQKIGMNVDFQALEWGTVVARRAIKEPVDKGGWNVFYTYLGGFGNISPGPDIAIRGNGTSAWFGWPANPKMEALRDSWFDAPNLAAQQKLCRDM